RCTWSRQINRGASGCATSRTRTATSSCSRSRCHGGRGPRQPSDRPASGVAAAGTRLGRRRARRVAMKAPDAGAEPFVPAGADIDRLREAVQGCRGCDLYRAATQAVFSTGRVTAPLVLVGEVFGDEEDKAGMPFVG